MQRVEAGTGTHNCAKACMRITSCAALEVGRRAHEEVRLRRGAARGRAALRVALPPISVCMHNTQLHHARASIAADGWASHR